MTKDGAWSTNAERKYIHFWARSIFPTHFRFWHWYRPCTFPELKILLEDSFLIHPWPRISPEAADFPCRAILIFPAMKLASLKVNSIQLLNCIYIYRSLLNINRCWSSPGLVITRLLLQCANKINWFYWLIAIDTFEATLINLSSAVAIRHAAGVARQRYSNDVSLVYIVCT